MQALLWKVLRDLISRRVRSALTILGIAMGVAGLVAITSTARNLVRAQRELYVSASQADISFWVWDAPASLARLLRADPRIAAVELRLTFVTRWRAREAWMDIELVGLDDLAQVGVNQFELTEGALPGIGEVLLEHSASQAAGISPGSTLAYRDPLGRERYLEVSGISRTPGQLSTAITKLAVGYVPASTLRGMLQISGSNQLLIRLHDFQDAQAVAEKVDRLLRRQGVQAGTPELRNPGQFVGKRELDALIVILFIFSGVGLVLSAFLVANTLAASVAEQIGEIGVLKALGGTRAQVLAVYLLQALAYGVVGTLLGIVVGTLGGWRLLRWIGSLGNASVSFRLAPEGLLLGAGVGIGVAVVGGLIPALQGTRIPVREALASYGISTDYDAGWLGRGLWRVGRISPLVSMAVRSLARRRVRSLLTILVVALSAAAFLSASATRDSVHAAITDIYTTYNADAWVWFGEALNLQSEALLRSVEGVRAAEGWVIANGVVGLAEARLWGLPSDSTLYQHVMRDGRWFRRDEPDALVLSAELADKQGIRPGDRVEVQAHGRTRLCDVVGIAIDNTIFLGGTLAGKAFMPRSTLGSMLGQEHLSSLFALGLASREPEAADRILAEVERKLRAWKPAVQPVYAEVASAQEASRLLTLALAAMLVIVSLVGCVGVLNTLTLNVLERRREVAVMRSMGATDVALLLVFVTEGLVLGGVGWLLGLILGYPAGRLFTAQLGQVLFALTFVFSPRAIAASFFFTLILATGSSLGPALGAAHIRASAALQYE